MELSNTFTVNLPVEDTWQVLTDLEFLASCVPGAALLGVDGDAHRGVVKVEVGSVSAQYQGIARFLEKDDQAFLAVLRAEGKDAGGHGTAAATVTARLMEQGEGTQVVVRTELALSGQVARLGRGVIADVSNKLLGRFVRRLEAEFASAPMVGSAPSERPAMTGNPPEPDVRPGMSGAIARRAIPAAGVLLALLIGFLLARKGRRRSAATLVNPAFLAAVGRAYLEEATR